MTPKERIRALSPAQRTLLARTLPESGEGGTRHLVAYVLVDPRRMPPVAELRDHASAALPGYMVPTSYVQLIKWPILPNGKIDRQALRDAGPAAQRASQHAFVPPSGETERAVARIWKELLGVGSVGANDNFFDLGGHSLLLVRLQSRLRDAFGAELSIIDLFRYPTVRGLTTALRAVPGVPAPAAGDGAEIRERAAKHRDVLKRRQARGGNHVDQQPGS